MVHFEHNSIDSGWATDDQNANFIPLAGGILLIVGGLGIGV
jgi:hypothetical protein